MDDKTIDLRNMLGNARWEILDLRRRNEILAAKVEVMDLFGLVFRTMPNYASVGASPDVTFELQKKLDEIEAAEALAHGG